MVCPVSHTGGCASHAGDDVPKLLIDYVHYILAHLFVKCKQNELDKPLRFLIEKTSARYASSVPNTNELVQRLA